MVSSTFMLLFCVTVAGRVSSDGTLSECVDLIELNHFYDRQGKHVYDQVIFYERHPGNGKYHVRAWCLVEDRESLNRRPLRDEVSNLYRVEILPPATFHPKNKIPSHTLLLDQIWIEPISQLLLHPAHQFSVYQPR